MKNRAISLLRFELIRNLPGREGFDIGRGDLGGRLMWSYPADSDVD